MKIDTRILYTHIFLKNFKAKTIIYFLNFIFLTKDIELNTFIFSGIHFSKIILWCMYSFSFSHFYIIVHIFASRCFKNNFILWATLLSISLFVRFWIDPSTGQFVLRVDLISEDQLFECHSFFLTYCLLLL